MGESLSELHDYKILAAVVAIALVAVLASVFKMIFIQMVE